jgi:hypothetical protein
MQETNNLPQTPPLQQTDVGRSTSMTAKQKAEDLILKYSILNDGHNHIVKECAKIAVREIISETGYVELWLSGHEYWEDVLNEIDAF